ncbi:LysR family transcriptional regulator [Limnobacter humi]|uniref:HTH-type transcriptional regulator MetR n=1 Tax=Limnobacter humi TaxID=1778671 RepID=A0ABT1WF67_9BURK|nr:LysR family transcriptional regulator [Limnobacter humi]MCQ8896134.1 LysR family transcriptional regulator [Limnobacter humi]
MYEAMLELRHLRTLKAIEETGSLSRAADVLCITQSAVSHQVKALEDWVGEELLYKQGGQTRFTVLGQTLLNLAHTVLAEVDSCELGIRQLKEGAGGPLRVAVECHTCFDWLMPAMDHYRSRWPEVELDIVSGFHADPVGLIHQSAAELAIVSEDGAEEGVTLFPLFKFEMVAVVPADSKLAERAYLRPSDFKNQTLITYPVPDDMLDVVRLFLKPAGVEPARRTSELTVALLQLVASRRGVSALPAWAVQSYVERGYVAQVRLGKHGLMSTLYAAVPKALAGKAYVLDFVHLVQDLCLRELPGVERAS